MPVLISITPQTQYLHPITSNITNTPSPHSWDDWVPVDRLRKFTDENKELAQTLKKNMEAVRQETTKSAKKPPNSHKKKPGTAGPTGAAQSSDFSSVRGSEERHSSVQAGTGARGQKRGRDYELDKVGTPNLANLSSLQIQLTQSFHRKKISSPAPRSGSPSPTRSNPSSWTTGRT